MFECKCKNNRRVYEHRILVLFITICNELNLQHVLLRKVKSVVPTASVTTVQVHSSHACALQDTSGMIVLHPAGTLTSVSLVLTTVCHQPDVSTHQGPTDVSALLS